MKKPFILRDTSAYPQELFDLPNDALLSAENRKKAPHETLGFLRMHRVGFRPNQISEITGIMNGPPLVDQIKLGLDQEGEASRRGVPIHDERIPKGHK